MSKVALKIEIDEEDFKSIEYSTLLYHLHATPITESDDCVSRQAVEEMIKAEMPERGMWEIEGDKIKETVCEVCVDLTQKLSDLPPVLPKREKGEWKNFSYGVLSDGAMCSKCKERTSMPCEFHYKICPNCGAEMTERGEK